MYKYPKEKTTIEVKFLPNFNYETKKVGDHIVEIPIGVRDEMRVSTLFFSIVSMNGKITILKYGIQIKKILDSLMQGCYLNSDGLYITAKDNQKIYDEDNDEYSLTEYYIDKDGNIILPYDTFDYKMDELEHRTDVVYQERFFPFDFASKFYFQFEIDWVMDGKFLKYDNFKLIEKDAIWTEGEDKDVILNMYKDVTTIDETVEQYKKETEINYPKTLFGEDALKERGKMFAKKAIENKEADLAEMKENYNSKYNIS